jgi:hypothetical protein
MKSKGINKPWRTPEGPKAFAVYGSNSGAEKDAKLVRFGDPDMPIQRDSDKARESFRARHKCSTAKDKTTARYWSCVAWDPATDWV